MGSLSPQPEPEPILQTLLHKHNVLMFSKTGCPYCVKAEQVFKRMEVEPTVYHMDKETNGMEVFQALVKLTTQRTVPNIFITQQHIGGYAELLRAVKNKTVQKLLTKANIPFKDI